MARIAVGATALAVFIMASGVLAHGAEDPRRAVAVSDRDAVSPVTSTPRARRVTVAAVERGAHQRERRFFGTVRATDRAALSFTLGGRLTARPYELGQHVERGAVLARLDAAQLANAVATQRATLAELEARVALQRSDRDRDVRLFTEGVIADAHRERSEAGYESLTAAREATRVRLRESRRQLGEANLLAPFDGEVVAVHLEPGEYAAPGVPVLTLSGSGELEVELEVPESVLPSLSEGAQVTVDLPLAGRRGVVGRVRSRGTASAGTGLFPVVVELVEAEGVRPGMTAEVMARVASSRGLTVPMAAVLDPSGRRPAVLVVESGRVRRVAVRVLELLDDRVVVTAELDVGDQVVIGGHTFLLDGDRVEVP